MVYSYTNKHINFLLVLLFVTNSISGNSFLQNSYSFNQISYEQGLPDANVRAQIQDRNGIIWISIESAGLCRYDGHRFNLFQHIDDDSTSISSNFINEIAEDNEGYLWLATDHGLNKFDPKTKKALCFFNESENDISIPDNVCQSVYVDKAGTLLVGTENGLAVKEANSNYFKHFFAVTGSSLFSKRISIISITGGENGMYWLGTNKGMILFNRKTGQYKRWMNNKDKKLEANEPIHNRIMTITPDNNGYLWVGTHRGLDRFNIDTETFVRWKYNTKDEKALELEGINALMLDKNNLLWVGSYTMGIIIINTNDLSYIRIHTQSQNGENSIKSNHIRYFLEDAQGLIWVGTKFEGLFKYNGYKNIFQWPDKFSKLAEFKTEYILSFHNDSNKTFWIGTKHNGLYKITNENVAHYTTNTKNKRQLPSNRIQHIIRDSEHNLWVGTEAGLVLYSDIQNTFIHYSNEPITWLCEDQHKNIWVGTTTGIFIVSKSKNMLQRFNSPFSHSIFLNNNIEIAQIFCDNNNNIWFSTRYNGLYKYSHETGLINNFTHSLSNKNSISDNMARAIHQDKSGNIWVGTKSKGVDVIDKNNNIIKTYTTSDGLPSNMILCIEESNNGNIWLGTHSGLSELNLKTGEILNYNSDFGLRSNIAEIGASHTFPDGEMLFGGSNGFNIFNPESLIIEKSHIDPLITSIKINDKERFVNISEEHSVTLRPSENFVSFEFTLPDYNNTYRHNYRVLLEGVDKEWKDLDNRNYISYTYLDPGSYSFKVKAANEYGNWTHELVFHLTIKKAFYQTNIFIVFIIVIIFILTIIIINTIKTRHIKLQQLISERTKKLEIAYKELLNKNTHIREQNRQIERHQNDLEQKVAERTHDLEIAKRKAEESDRLKSSFLANMSHEIRTPLNAITGFSNLICNDTVTPERKQKYVSIIKSNNSSLLKLVEDILDVSKIEAHQLKIEKEYFDLDNLIYDLTTIFAEEVKIKRGDKVKLTLKRTTPPESSVSLYSDPIRLKQIMDNLLSNAVKFTYKGFIETGYQLKQNRVLFWIKDTGIGIKKEDIELIFNRFTKVETDNAIYRGTGLGLSITQSLVEMLGGEIWVESTFNAGSTFFFELPGQIKISNQPDYNKNHTNKSNLKDKKILIVEDERSNFVLIQSYLMKSDADLTWAHSGNIAIEYCKNQHYDLILLDIKMPIIDGYETFRQIKKINSQYIIIAQTAFASAEERIRIATTGFNDFIIKPYSKDELIHKISNFL